MDLYVTLTNLVSIVSIILGMAVAAWFIIGLYWVHSRREEKELPEIDLPANLHEVFTGVPPVLIVFYAFIFLSSLGYVAYIWLRGINY